MTVEKKDTVLDNYYFHISNSGISVETKETTVSYDFDPRKGLREYKEWFFSHSLHAFGIGVETELPLRTVEQLDTYIKMLQNVRERMVGFYGEEGKAEHESLGYARPTIVNTFKAEEVYSEEVVTKNSKGKDLLGYQLTDSDGNVKGFIKNTVEGLGRYESACCDDDTEENDTVLTVSNSKD